jgi:two-component system NtrC family sensor kinase
MFSSYIRLPYRLGPKLILSLTVLIVLIGSLTGFLNLRTQKARMVETMVLGADQLSKSITSATWHAMNDDHREAAYEIMMMIARNPGIDRIRMFNRDGRLRFSTDTREQPDSLTITPGLAHVRFSNSPAGVRTLNMITPIYNEHACSNAECHAHPAGIKVLGVLDLALRLDPVQQQEQSITMQAVVSTAGFVIVGAAFVILFTHLFVAVPIRELIHGIRSMKTGDLERPIEITHRSQELDQLVESFNVMRARVSEMTRTLESKVKQRTDELKTAHLKLLQADRLASLGQLAASVAHEINNPISGVLNLSMLVERIVANGQIPPGREAEVRKYLKQISSQTTRVGLIVSDLLAFSRRSKPQRSPSDLNKLVRTTVGLIGHKLKLIGAEPMLDLQPDLPLVECDGSQIQQVILNLTLNAAEAMQSKQGGTLTVSTRLTATKDAIELRVQDTGEGIAPENLSKIFDPFFTTKPEGKGVGLGLAVLYGIIKAHDGEVEVSSRRDQGTTFTVTLPLSRAEVRGDAA